MIRKRGLNREMRRAARRRLLELKAQSVDGKEITWHELSRQIGINRGYLCAIAAGRKKASEKVIQALGIERPEPKPRINWRAKYEELARKAGEK